MSHNEKRQSVLKEAQLALFTGSLYGGVHTISGHPLDTIKSKMQLQTGYNASAWTVTRKIYSTHGRDAGHGSRPAVACAHALEHVCWGSLCPLLSYALGVARARPGHSEGVLHTTCYETQTHM